jgi:hypothetical protein
MPEIPIGLEFLKLVNDQENACEAETRKHIPELGKAVPACFEELGTAMSFLDRSASCFWGCRKGDHVIEYIVGRVMSSCRASLRLILFGFYDESLSITRGIGEIANLLLLFNQDDASYQEWLQLDADARLKKFSPVKVRLKLEYIDKERGLNLHMLSIDEHRYRTLSSIAAHVTPHTKPQDYNLVGRPVLGARLQDVGVMTCLNELSRVVGLILAIMPGLLEYELSLKKEVHGAAISLLASVGSVDVMTDWQTALGSRDKSESTPGAS